MRRLSASVAQRAAPGGPLEVLIVATRLGLTSFGGPVAHIGYFREEYVRRRGWLSADEFSDLVSLCQALPGPASSELGIAIGWSRAGAAGAAAAWLGFTLPSAVFLIAVATGVVHAGSPDAGWLAGLRLVAVAVVAQAVVAMTRVAWRTLPRIGIGVGSLAAILIVPTAATQIAVLGAAAVVGWAFRPRQHAGIDALAAQTRSVPRMVGFVMLTLLGTLLVGLAVLRRVTTSHLVAMVDAYFQTGALVFGGGHVVLPLLQTQVVATHWVTNSVFLAGYGAAQAVPGPLFTFAAFLGAAQGPSPNGIGGGLIALVAIFAPAFLLVFGVLPFWGAVRRGVGVMAAIGGVNAAVVGLLAAALWTPVITTSIHNAADAVFAAAAVVLVVMRVPAWVIVVLGAAFGALLL
jgi:chromate transporter